MIDPRLRRRQAIAALLAGGAIVALLLAVGVMGGSGYDWRLGPVRLRVHDYVRPLIAGALLDGVLLLCVRRRRLARTAALSLLAVCGLLALVAYARQAAEDYAPVGDIAVLESYTIHATNWELFLGPYSRFAWNHPGPLYFFILAPFYVLSESRTSGLSAAALAINLGSLLTIAWITLRMGRGLLAVVTTALGVVFMWRTEEMLASQWNPHVLVLPTMVLILLCAAMVSGRPGLLPSVAFVATFAVQTHLGLVPTVLALSGISLAAVMVSAYRSGDGTEPRRVWRSINATLWLVLALWLLPLAQQLHNTPGNLGELWRFFALEEHAGQRFRDAYVAWADMLSGVVRPDFYVAWGGRLRKSQFLWSQGWALVQVLLLGWVTIRAVRVRDRFQSALTGLLLLASLVALWSVTRVEDDLVDHAVFWISGLGVLNAAVLIDRGVAAFWRQRSPGVRWATLVCGFSWIVAAAVGVQQLRVVISRSFRPAIEQLAARRLSDALQSYMGSHDIGKPLVRIDQPTWGIAAGVLLQLQKQGIPFAVEKDWISMFTAAVAAKGDETSVLTFAGPERRYRLLSEPGQETIAERDSIWIILGRTPPPVR